MGRLRLKAALAQRRARLVDDVAPQGLTLSCEIEVGAVRPLTWARLAKSSKRYDITQARVSRG